MRKVYVDEDLCIGCGSCEAVCPTVFQLGDNGLAFAQEAQQDDLLEACIAQAVSICPTEAIKFHEGA